MTKVVRVLSYGAGVQSTTVLLLAERLGLDAAIYCDLGLAESPDTRNYANSVAKDIARSKGVRLITVHYDLYNAMMSNPAHPLAPFRDERNVPAMRQCTNDIAREAKGLRKLFVLRTSTANEEKPCSGFCMS